MDALDNAYEIFALAERPEEAIALYLSLFEKTKRAAGDLSKYLRLSPDPRSGNFFLEEIGRASANHPALLIKELTSLTTGWWRYSRLWDEVLRRSPLMELEDYLQRLSQSHALTGWSDQVEHIPHYIDRGEGLDFDDRHGVLTQRVIDRCHEIRRFTNGWIYGYIWANYFLTDDQLKQVPQENPRDFLENAARSRPSFEGLQTKYLQVHESRRFPT